MILARAKMGKKWKEKKREENNHRCFLCNTWWHQWLFERITGKGTLYSLQKNTSKIFSINTWELIFTYISKIVLCIIYFLETGSLVQAGLKLWPSCLHLLCAGIYRNASPGLEGVAWCMPHKSTLPLSNNPKLGDWNFLGGREEGWCDVREFETGFFSL